MAEDRMDWSHLPSDLVVEILSYLSHGQRLTASGVCKSWRKCLLHPALWRKATLYVNHHNNVSEEGRQFKVNLCGRFVRHVILEFNSSNSCDIRECKDVLKVLARNRSLRSLTLRPTSGRFEWVESDIRQLSPLPEQFIEAINSIIHNADRLTHLSFGCIEELLDHIDSFLLLLKEWQCKSLRSLHIPSVKEDPFAYPLLDMKPGLFEAFQQLQILGIDYDYISDQLLRVLSSQHKVPLLKLLIHVHGIDSEHPGVSDKGWLQLRKHSPAVTVTLNLLHSCDHSSILRDILNPSMPLTSFRSFFSIGLDAAFLDGMARFNGETLQSVYIAESLSDYLPSGSFSNAEEDPLVMLAWRCKNLSHLSIFGYEVSNSDLIAIARLRGPLLKELRVPLCCITIHSMEDTASYMAHASTEAQQTFVNEISDCLGRCWNPLTKEELPPSVANLHMDANGTYLPMLLQDQAWELG